MMTSERDPNYRRLQFLVNKINVVVHIELREDNIMTWTIYQQSGRAFNNLLYIYFSLFIQTNRNLFFRSLPLPRTAAATTAS